MADLKTETPFGMTVGEHLHAALEWIENRKPRLHHEGCSFHLPSARCNCGLHKALTDLRAAINVLEESQATQAQEGVRQPEPPASQEKPRPEPAGYVTAIEEGKTLFLPRASLNTAGLVPLYAGAEPVARQALTPEQLDAIYCKAFGLIDSRLVGKQIDFARAIEAAVLGIPATPAPKETPHAD